MNIEHSAQLNWFKSSYSSGEGGACVEVAMSRAAIHIRDSKRQSGPQLTVAHEAWAGFVVHVGETPQG